MPQDLHEILSDQVRRLDSPHNLFRGISPHGLVTPKNILLFGRLERKDLQPHEDHRYQHRRFVLMINLRTPGSVAVDGRWHRLGPGDLFLIFPHEVHAYGNMKESAMCWLFLTFELDDSLSLEILRGKVLPYLGTSPVGTWLEQILAAWNKANRNPAELAHLTALLLDALQRLARTRSRRAPKTAPAPADDPSDLLLPAVHEIIDQERPACRIKDLALCLKMSESHLRARFRKQTGQSLGHYLLHMRISRAAAMLVRTKTRVGEIAELCGFDSLYSFSRSFRRITGTSPRTYRNEAALSSFRK